MTFNIEKFSGSEFNYPVIDIKVPTLEQFFEEDELAIWQVKGLTGHELAKVNEAIKLNKDVASIISGISSEVNSEKIDAIKEVLGINDTSPDDLVRRLSALVLASVSPEITQEIAVKLADSFPTVFYLLTNKIFELTGDGKSLGESKASGEIVTSEAV